MEASCAGQNRPEEGAQSNGVDTTLWNRARLEDDKGVPTAWALSSVRAANALTAINLSVALLSRVIAIDQPIANQAGALATLRTIQ